jgi:hypothetical protein
VPGLLADYPDESSLIRHIDPARLAAVEGLAQGRMKKKLLAAGGAGRAACPGSSWPTRGALRPVAPRSPVRARSSGTD